MSEKKKAETAEEAKAVKPGRLVKARFLGVVCGTYGSFQAGEVAEVPEDVYSGLAAAFLAERAD